MTLTNTLAIMGYLAASSDEQGVGDHAASLVLAFEGRASMRNRRIRAAISYGARGSPSSWEAARIAAASASVMMNMAEAWIIP